MKWGGLKGWREKEETDVRKERRKYTQTKTTDKWKALIYRERVNIEPRPTECTGRVKPGEREKQIQKQKEKRPREKRKTD